MMVVVVDCYRGMKVHDYAVCQNGKLLLSVFVLDWHWVGACFLDGGWLRTLILMADTPYPSTPHFPKLPCSTGEYSSAYHGRLHSQPPRVNNVPNNYVTVFGLPCEKVHPPSSSLPLLCYSMQIGKDWSLRTSSYGAGPDYDFEANWMASMGGQIWIGAELHRESNREQKSNFFFRCQMWKPLCISKFVQIWHFVGFFFLGCFWVCWPSKIAQWE